MGSVTAVVHNGRIELAQPIDWPDGTQVEVTPINNPAPRTDWLSLPPLDVGEFRELTSDDDLLGEMLDDSQEGKAEWPFLPPLEVGEFRPITSEDDLLGEMLDDSRP